MRVTFLGHAGLYIETRHASILCDPWLSGPAFHDSWWPFPDNDRVDRDAVGRPTYLYISHLHYDHYDQTFLRDHVSKEATVLLPDYPLVALERELRRIGFERFIQTRSWEPVDLDGLRLTVPTMVSPADGPIGDSGLVVESGGVTLFNQNDSRPVHGLHRLGHVDVHFLQFSGAIGYPFLQGYPEKMRVALGRRKRLVSMERARRYVEAVRADKVFPSSGPPCFLDPALFWLNDVGDDEGNVFPDQWQFFEYMARHGDNRPEVILPCSVVEVTPRGSHVVHPMPAGEMRELFSPDGKRRYLADYQARKRTDIERIDRSLRRADDLDVVAALREWWEPLLARADLLCAGVNGRMTVDFEETPGEGFVTDFRDRTVRPWLGARSDRDVCHFRFRRALVSRCVLARREDWNTDLLLSFRFQSHDGGLYNKYLFAFLSALSEERIDYVESFYRRELSGEPVAHHSFFHVNLRSGRHLVQQRCPHAGADLAHFLEYDEDADTLTCTVHGWQWRRDGTCLTAHGHPLYVRPAEEPESGAEVRRQCGDCAYRVRPPALAEFHRASGEPGLSRVSSVESGLAEVNGIGG
jgi:UDP-MurNAc hydroxylase